MYHDVEMECANDTKNLGDMIERKRTFYFLVGPNLEFDEISGRVLGKNPLPSISDLFAYVQGEEECKGIMLQRYDA